MNKDEFNAWVSKNVGKGGSRPRIDLFNKSHKGKERNPTAAEYPCKDIPEYHRYSEYWKFKEEDEDKKQEDKRDNNDDKSRSSKASQNAGNIAKNVVKNIVPKVIAVVAGSVIMVVSYNDLKAKEAQAAVLKTEWVWSEDYASATLSLYNQNNLLVKTRDGVITVIENPASCTESGDKTYTATVKDQDKTYTDSRNVILDPLGHDFDEGVKAIVDGNPTITYTCIRCGETFSITIDTGEEEGLGLHNEEHPHIHHEHLTEWCEHCEHHHHLD